MSTRVASTPPCTVPASLRCSSVASSRTRARPSSAVRSATPRTAAKPALLKSVTTTPYPGGGLSRTRGGPEAVKSRHVVGGELEVGDVRVRPDPLGVAGLGDDHDAVLQVPTDDHLRRCSSCLLGDVHDRRVLEGPAAQCAVALEGDAAGA